MKDTLQDIAARMIFGIALALPYERRVPFAGWLFARVVAPLAGYTKRIRANLALVVPDMPEVEIRRLQKAVPDNLGRTFIEIYSGAEFLERIRQTPMTGEGLQALEEAKESGGPIIMVSGHFGNFEGARAALNGFGLQVGAVYRPMNNKKFNTHYIEAVSKIGTPLFPRGRKGMGQMLKFLRGGGTLGLLVDQHMKEGEELSFFGHTAHTATSAADLALKFNAPLFPAYCTRLENGIDFDIVVEAPIPHSDPQTMTQAINDSLEVHVRAHMDQWLWTHRRWK